MDYTTGKWFERLEAKLNAVLQLNGIDPNTLEPLEPIDQTTQTPEETPPETDETPETTEETGEAIDTSEPQAGTKEELNAKAEAIKKSMSKKQRVDVNGNPI